MLIKEQKKENDGAVGMEIRRGFTLQRTVQRVLQRMLTNAHGIPKGTLKALQDATGIEFPPPLWEFYFKVGRLDTIMNAWDILYKPSQAYIVRKHLMFMRSREGDRQWACALDNEDPAVFLYENGRFVKEDAPLSEFLFIILFWQLARGAFQYRGQIGEKNADEVLFSSIETDFEKAVDYKGIFVYYKPGTLVCFQKDRAGRLISGEEGVVLASARTRKLFNELRDNYGFCEIAPNAPLQAASS